METGVSMMIAIALAVLLVATVALYERELGRLARFLRRRDRSANERATVSFSTPGVAGVAAAANAELDALRDERAKMADRQEAFQRDLAALSHDIRTPLAGAQGYLQLYERTADPDERARCLREAAARLSAMRDLTDRLFEYAKAADADSPLLLERVEVLPVLASVLAGAYPQLSQRGWDPAIDFEDEGIAVLADADALERVFGNLVANSLRHGSSAPRIAARAASAEGGAARAAATAEGEPAGSGSVEISFANRVVDPAALDPNALFDRFYRADAARSGEGSGLGLSIVASLVSRMGGAVAARLDDDCLVVTVELPAR